MKVCGPLARHMPTRLSFFVLLLAACAVACGATSQRQCAVATTQPGNTLVAITSRSVPDGRVTVAWMGRDPGTNANPGTPVALWIKEAWFYFKRDAHPLRYRAVLPSAEPSQWTFDIFSPDGQYVALLQESGDIHVIRTDNLRAYLLSRRAPDDTVTGRQDPDDEEVFLEELRWTSNDTLEATASCCGTYWSLKHRIGQATEFGEVQSVDR